MFKTGVNQREPKGSSVELSQQPLSADEGPGDDYPDIITQASSSRLHVSPFG